MRFARRRRFLTCAPEKSPRPSATAPAPTPAPPSAPALSPPPPLATAEDVEAMRALPRDAIGRAIAHYRDTRFEAARAADLAELDGRLARFAALEAAAACDAEAHLVRAILATAPDRGRPGRGVLSEGTLYLAVPEAGVPGRMRLAVVERAAVLDLARVRDVGALVPGPAPDLRSSADPSARPAWVDRLMAEAEALGPVEAWRRIFGVGSRLGGSVPDWRGVILETIAELGRTEATRRLAGGGV